MAVQANQEADTHKHCYNCILILKKSTSLSAVAQLKLSVADDFML